MIKRPLCRLVSILLLATLLFSSYGEQANAQTQSTIRVWLKRLQVSDTLEIDVQGNYMLEGGQMTFSDGAKLTVVLRNGQLVLHSGSMRRGDHRRTSTCRKQRLV